MTSDAENDEAKTFLESLNRYWAESRSVHVCRLDREGRILEINACLADLLKRGAEAVKGHPFSDFLTDPDAHMLNKRLASHVPMEPGGFFLNVVDVDLAPQTLQCWLLRLPEDRHMILGELPEHRCHILQQELLELNNQLATLSREAARKKKELAKAMEERDAAYRKMSEMAFQDPLTLLANRRKLEETFHLEVERASRLGQPLTVVMMDIDHFKSINDTYGHAMGDEVLQELARALSRQARPYDLVSRYGGEEFLILMPGIGLEQGKSAAERLRACVSAIRIEGIPHPITASFGVATLKPGQSPNTLFDRADQALYRAKAGGRNRVVVEQTEENEGALAE